MKFSHSILAALAVVSAVASPAKRATTTKAAAATGAQCGVKGYDKTASYSYDGTAADANFVSCSAKCKADSKCLSFAFGSSQCLLYKVSVYENRLPGKAPD
jgi:hypothetical protein